MADPKRFHDDGKARYNTVMEELKKKPRVSKTDWQS